jgi:hypothetical protein
MALIVKIKSKKQEKAVKDFLAENDIDFQTIAEEDVAPYITKTRKQSGRKAKQILTDLDKSVEFVNKYRKGKVKAKSLNQLLNEL